MKLFLIVLYSLITFQAAQAQDKKSPVSCRIIDNDKRYGIDFFEIECTIRADNLEIKDIVLNRGVCISPSEVFDAGKDECTKDPNKSSCKYYTPEADFRKSYRFADKFTQPISCKPIEYTIVTDQGSWTAVRD